MSSAIDASNILSAIAKLEGDLAKLKIALGVPDVVVPKSRKSAPKADGEKKAPNVWIRFTQQVDAALKAASISTGAAPVAKQFASALKDQKPYSEWTDESIVEAWATWEKPEQSKMGAEKQRKSDSEGSDSGSVKERKKRAPMTEEAKAAMAAKRAATKAAKTGAPLPESAPTSDGEEAVASDAGSQKERKKRAPMTEEAKAAMKAKREATKAAKAGGGGGGDGPAASAVPEPEADKPEPIAAPKPMLKKKAIVAPTFTIEQLKDFDSVTIDGEEYGRNVRGDVCSADDGAYVGHWDGKKLAKGAAPADWEQIQPSA
jgi:hypothetical protein